MRVEQAETIFFLIALLVATLALGIALDQAFDSGESVR